MDSMALNLRDVAQGRVPPLGLISFIFMQPLGKFDQIIPRLENPGYTTKLETFFSKQECIQVGCVPNRLLTLSHSIRREVVSAPGRGGGSAQRWVSALGVSAQGGGVCPGGVCPGGCVDRQIPVKT